MSACSCCLLGFTMWQKPVPSHSNCHVCAGEMGTTPRLKLIDPNHAWKRFNHEKKTRVLNHDLVCLGSMYINQISLVKLFGVSFGSFEVELCHNYVHIRVSSSQKGLYYKSMMWHAMCKFFGIFSEKFLNKGILRNFEEAMELRNLKEFKTNEF